MLSNAERYLVTGLLGDLVLGCGDWTQQPEQGIELGCWLGFIRKVINRYGLHLASLQITTNPIYHLWKVQNRIYRKPL